MFILKGTVPLETERLILRRFTPEDAVQMYRNWASDPAVTRFVTWDVHASADDTRALLQMWTAEYEKNDYHNWCIVEKESGEAIGNITVPALRAKHRAAEIGYCLSSSRWNRGYTTEALEAVLRFLFEECGFHRVSARHDARNPASGRVMQKCGMRYEGTNRDAWLHREGVFDDLVCYAILEDEWSALHHA